MSRRSRSSSKNRRRYSTIRRHSDVRKNNERHNTPRIGTRLLSVPAIYIGRPRIKSLSRPGRKGDILPATPHRKVLTTRDIHVGRAIVRQKSRCLRGKDARRHYFFRSKMLGGSSRPQHKRRHNKCGH